MKKLELIKNWLSYAAEFVDDLNPKDIAAAIQDIIDAPEDIDAGDVNEIFLNWI